MVSVVGVRVVLVGVLDGRVPMPMPGPRRHGRAVLVLVVFVVRVPGVVADRLVPMGGNSHVQWECRNKGGTSRRSLVR